MTKRRSTVLAIDDTPANLMALGAALGDDFELQVATSGESGLAVAREVAPDLILLDVMMPDMDGYETYRRLAAEPRLRGIPVIFLTALHGFESENLGLAMGAADYITKPINLEITRQRICNLLEREQLRRQVESQRDQLEHTVRQRTAQLQDRMEELQAIFALSPDGFVSFDQDRRVSQVSPTFSRLTGLTAATVTGLDEGTFTARLADLCIGKARYRGASELTALGQLDVDRELSLDWETIALKVPEGRVLKVTLRQCNSSTVSHILYLRDVTRETEVDRMKTQFLEMAAHELRTPLTSVLGYTEVLLSQDFDAPEHREVLGIVHQQAEQVTSIVNELLDLVRIDSRRGQDFVVEPLALPALVEEAVAAYKLAPGRRAPLVRPPQRTLRVTGDRRKIAQVLGNLISNAYKYSPDGGEVSIGYPVAPHEGVSWCGVEVRDRGLGMTPAQLARCFERFYRADTSGKIPGTGLGLCIVKEIMDLHGGRIDIQSTPGDGTTVTLWLVESMEPQCLT
jgi:signal transduction histidine kinase/DNA-binding response OmpR family regulator